MGRMACAEPQYLYNGCTLPLPYPINLFINDVQYIPSRQDTSSSFG